MGRIYLSKLKQRVVDACMATGEPYKVAKQEGVPGETVRRWYNEALEQQERDGSLGTWTEEMIVKELEVLRQLNPGRNEAVGDVNIAEERCSEQWDRRLGKGHLVPGRYFWRYTRVTPEEGEKV